MRQVLVTFYEVETRRRNHAASRLQGLSRMRKARERARSFILSQFEKRFDVYSGKFYYHSNKTGVDTFVKPRLLRPDQVKTPAPFHVARITAKQFKNPALPQDYDSRKLVRSAMNPNTGSRQMRRSSSSTVGKCRSSRCFWATKTVALCRDRGEHLFGRLDRAVAMRTQVQYTLCYYRR